MHKPFRKFKKNCVPFEYVTFAAYLKEQILFQGNINLQYSNKHVICFLIAWISDLKTGKFTPEEPNFIAVTISHSYFVVLNAKFLE